jgi:hypothetical protein
MYYPMPVCCPAPEITETNVGWCMGVMEDGVPFVAELCETSAFDLRELTLYLPFQQKLFPSDWMGFVLAQDYYCALSGSDDCEQSGYVHDDLAVLSRGMEVLDHHSHLMDDDMTAIRWIEYLDKMQIIYFPGETCNGVIKVLRDFAGRTIVAMTFSMIKDGSLIAETSLHFEDFSTWQSRAIAKNMEVET